MCLARQTDLALDLLVFHVMPLIHTLLDNLVNIYSNSLSIIGHYMTSNKI